MVYSSSASEFFVDLEKKFKESVYLVFYTIQFDNAVEKTKKILESPVEWIPGKTTKPLVALWVQYLKTLNKWVARVLKKDPMQLPEFPTLSELENFFELAPVDFKKIKHWGNYFWQFLHYSSIYMNIMKDDPVAYGEFYGVLFNIDFILPCHMCSENYRKKKPILENEILPKAQTDAIRAIFDLHSLVNQHTNPGKYTDFTFDKFLTLYDLVIIDDGENVA